MIHGSILVEWVEFGFSSFYGYGESIGVDLSLGISKRLPNPLMEWV